MRTSSKSHTINDMHIEVLDNLFTPDEEDDMVRRAKVSQFRRTEYSKNNMFLFHSSDFNLTEVRALPMYHKIVDELRFRFSEKHITLNRAYINELTYGDVPTIHQDTKEYSITALYYVNQNWNREWGGETIYYGNYEPEIIILPKQGRLILADGRIPHIGRSPTRLCNEARYTIAMKFTVGQ